MTDFNVHINHGVSQTVEVPAGLPQGACISPILYALFIADIPTDIDTDTQIALYADDTAMFTAAEQSNTVVNRLNVTLHLYLKKWKIKINNDKKQATIFPFGNKFKRIPSAKIKCSQSTVSPTLYAILGLTFEKKN